MSINKENNTAPKEVTGPLTEFLRDVRHHPDSFKGLDYVTLVKAIKDVENQSFSCKLDDPGVISFKYKPQYSADIMALNKPGFKDLPPNKKFITGVTIDLTHANQLMDRIQLVIHASKDRPVNYAIRFMYYGWKQWGEVPCTSDNVRETFLRVNGR